MFKFANLKTEVGVLPFEVVAMTDTVLKVRAMKTRKDHSWVPVINRANPPPLVLNQNDQKWFYEVNDNMPVVEVTKNAAGEWFAEGYGTFNPADAPVRFYNYNI